MIYTKKYRVEVWSEEGGYVYVDAKSPEEAESKVNEHIEEYGIDGLEFDRKTSDYGINLVEVVE